VQKVLAAAPFPSPAGLATLRKVRSAPFPSALRKRYVALDAHPLIRKGGAQRQKHEGRYRILPRTSLDSQTKPTPKRSPFAKSLASTQNRVVHALKTNVTSRVS